MSAQDYNLRFRGGGSTKSRKENRKSHPTLDASSISNDDGVTLPEEPNHETNPEESPKTLSTLQTEPKVRRSNVAQPTPKDTEGKKSKRFIAFIGKSSRTIH